MSKKLSVFSVLLLTLALLVSGCSGEDQSAGPLGDWTLQIVGDGLDITLDAAAMNSREQAALECTNVSSTGEVVTTQIEGFSFRDLLAENGVEQASLSEITFVCADGYEMMVPAEIFKAKDIIIMLKQDGELLTAPRSAIPDERAMFWAKELTQIKITGDGGAAAAQGDRAHATEKIILFRQAASAMEAVELQYKNAAIAGNYSLTDFAADYLNGVPEGTVYLTATDGFEKTESASAFFANYLLLENNASMDGAPRTWSPEVGEGMNTKFLAIAIIGTDAIYFVAETPVSGLFAAAGLNAADNYKFVASDGYEVEIPAAAISSGTISYDAEKKMMRADFTDQSLNDNQKKVKYLISVEAVK